MTEERKDNSTETAKCNYCGTDFKPTIFEDKYCEEHSDMCREEERDQMMLDGQY